MIENSSLKKKVVLTFLISCSLFVSENVCSQQHWNRDYMKLSYNDADTAIVLKFEFFDYAFGPAYENGYLDYCNFYFSHDGGNYTHFMNASTSDQSHDNWSWVDMQYKLAGTRLQFNDCYEPAAGTMWADNISKQRVNVYNTKSQYDTDLAWLTIKWFLGTKYRDAFYIKIVGKWNVNGVWPNQDFNEVYCYQVYTPGNKALKEEANPIISKNSAVKVSAKSDAIVIKGAGIGEKIKVYTSSGALIKSVVTSNDEVKIELPANQIYVVNIGQKHYKIAL